MADMKYIIDTSDVIKAQKDIRQWAKVNKDSINSVNRGMSSFGKTSELAFNQFGRAATQAQQKSKRFASVGLQQVGYQIGDFAVQVQGGTNVAVAFGQQMSQLLGIFGAGGAIAGAAVAIGTAIIAPLIDARKQARGLQEDIDSLQKTLRQEAFGFGSEKQLDTYAQILSLNGQIAEQEAAKASASGRNAKAIEGVINRLKGEKAELQEILEDYRLAEQRIDRLRENQERSNQELEVANSRSTEFAKKAEAIRKSYESLREEIGEAATQALVLSNIDLSSGINAATKAAAQLAAQLGISVQRASQIQTMGVLGAQGEQMPGGLGGPGGPFKVFEGTDDPLGKKGTVVNKDMFKTPSGRSGGGGGGGGTSAVDKAREEFERLKRSLDEAYDSQQKLKEGTAILDAALKSGAIQSTEEYNRLLGLLREEYGMTASAGGVFAEEMKKIGETAKNAMGDAFMSIVDGTKSAKDAFKDMARAVLKQAFELLVIKPILDGIFGGSGGGGGFLSGLFANGAAFSGGKVTAFANGGVVNGPTVFPMANGMGLMGEAGPEAVMPLKRGKNGKLGVQMEGGSQQPVVINQSFNFSANGDESVKRIIAQEAPRIANLTQKQIMDQRRRGGAMKSTFG